MKFTSILLLFLSFIIFVTARKYVVVDEPDVQNSDESGNVAETRIIGGVANARYAHMVSLQQNRKHFCGGSIITPDWVLTSAHCKKSNVEVIAGSRTINRISPLAQRRNVQIFIGHEDFDNSVEQSADDIALAKVDRSFQFNSLVSFVELPIALTYPSGNGEVTGWGQYLSRLPVDSIVLRRQVVPIYSVASCSVLWSNSNYTDTNVCAGHMNGIGATCESDRGGPLMTEVSRRRFNIVGIASWSQCSDEIPSVYTLVSSYLDWIKRIIDEN